MTEPVNVPVGLNSSLFPSAPGVPSLSVHPSFPEFGVAFATTQDGTTTFHVVNEDTNTEVVPDGIALTGPVIGALQPIGGDAQPGLFYVTNNAGDVLIANNMEGSQVVTTVTDFEVTPQPIAVTSTASGGGITYVALTTIPMGDASIGLYTFEAGAFGGQANTAIPGAGSNIVGLTAASISNPPTFYVLSYIDEEGTITSSLNSINAVDPGTIPTSVVNIGLTAPPLHGLAYLPSLNALFFIYQEDTEWRIFGVTADTIGDDPTIGGTVFVLPVAPQTSPPTQLAVSLVDSVAEPVNNLYYTGIDNVIYRIAVSVDGEGLIEFDPVATQVDINTQDGEPVTPAGTFAQLEDQYYYNSTTTEGEDTQLYLSITAGDPHVLCLDGSRLDVYEEGEYLLFDDTCVQIYGTVAKRSNGEDYWKSVRVGEQEYDVSEDSTIKPASHLTLITQSKYDTIALQIRTTERTVYARGLLTGSQSNDFKHVELGKYSYSASFYGGMAAHMVTIQKRAIKVGDGCYRYCNGVNVMVRDGKVARVKILASNRELEVASLTQDTDVHLNDTTLLRIQKNAAVSYASVEEPHDVGLINGVVLKLKNLEETQALSQHCNNKVKSIQASSLYERHVEHVA